MKLYPLAIALVVILSILPYARGAAGDYIEVKSDLQMIDVMDIFGGHITWIIHGNYARELREAIAEKYGVSTIDLGTASRYFKHDLERVVENNIFGCGYLGFVRITRADPLHDDTQGILNDVHDVEGLIGEVNSDSPITLRMLIRGHPSEGRHPVNTENLTFAPFYALVDNESEISKFGLDFSRVSTEHREILAGLGSLSLPEGTLTLRFIVGEFFMSSGGWVRYSSFDPLNSPLVLFIIYLAGIYVLGWYHNILMGEKRDTLMEKRARRYTTSMKMLLILLYLLLPLSGLYYIIILSAVVGISYPVVRKIYGE